MVAGILAAYAAQLKAKDDFAPVWPQAFPEHLRNGGGNMPQAKVTWLMCLLSHDCCCWVLRRWCLLLLSCS